MSANAAPIAKNPSEIDARRARLVWGKLGGYPLWPGITYSSWEQLAADAVQGIKFSPRLREQRSIVLFFESFTFQVLKNDSIQAYADVDHAKMLAAAKPRWKAKLTQAVSDAEEFIAGKTIPQIMSARKEANMEGKTASRAASKRKAAKLAQQAIAAPEQSKTATKKLVLPPRAAKSSAQTGAAINEDNKKREQPSSEHHGSHKHGRKVDSDQQTVPTAITATPQAWLGVPISLMQPPSANEQAPELRHVTQRNLSMLNSMLHAAQLQQQLIGNYLAQYQQQTLLNLVAQEYMMQPSRGQQSHPMHCDANTMQQRFAHMHGPVSHFKSPMDQVFQGPAGASSVFSEHLESSTREPTISCFDELLTDEPPIVMNITSTASKLMPSIVPSAVCAPCIDATTTKTKTSGTQPITLSATSAMASLPAPLPHRTLDASSAQGSVTTAESTHTEAPVTEPQTSIAAPHSQLPGAEAEEAKSDDTLSEESEVPAPRRRSTKSKKGAARKSRPLKAKRVRPVRTTAAVQEESVTPPARSRSSGTRKEIKPEIEIKSPIKARKTSQHEPTNSFATQLRPHRHALLSFWDLPVFRMLKSVAQQSDGRATNGWTRSDEALFAVPSTEQLISVDVRNDAWFSDESESSRADEDLLEWVGDALELVADKRSRRKQVVVTRTPADVAHSLRASDRLSAHTLIDPATYSEGTPQPFTLKVHPQVAAVTDLHAHCCDAEVIGFLAGWYDKATNTLYVQFAVPCTSTDRADDGSTDVELDPEAAIIAKEQIWERGLILVGWYHTHPRFKAEPSVTDILNHNAQQNMFDHPFVGLIVSTFDAGAVKVRASHRWFHTMDCKSVVVPMVLEPTYRALNDNHTDVAVPFRLAEPISKQFEELILEGNVERWQSPKPLSPTTLLPPAAAQTMAHNSFAARLIRSLSNPMIAHGPVTIVPPGAAAHATAADEVSEPASGSGSSVVASDGPTETQAIGNGSDDGKKRALKTTKAREPSARASKKTARSQPPHFTNIAPTALDAAVEQTDAAGNAGQRALTAHNFFPSTHPHHLFVTGQADAHGPAAFASAFGGHATHAISTYPPPSMQVQQQSTSYLASDEQGSPSHRLPFRGAGGPETVDAAEDDSDYLAGVAGQQNRRASHRVPKRKKFDDEKVEGFSAAKRTKPIGRPPKSKKKGITPQHLAQEIAPAQLAAAGVSPISLVRSPSRSRNDQSARDFLWAYLRADHQAGKLARRLVATARPFVQVIVQSVVVIGIYYAAHPRRVQLSERWRQATKLDKMVYSMGGWLLYLGMTDSDVHSLMFEIRDFLCAAWALHSSGGAALC